MDEIVKAALKKWPNVPHCYGWLALDARGDWYLRDEQAQAAGPFARVKGSRIAHPKFLAFIQRNYAHDERGCWFFQNGPQRVYVELEAAPLVWRLDRAPTFALRSHTEAETVARGAWIDEGGRLFLDSEIGFGLVHTLDMGLAADAVEQGRWQPVELPFGEMPARFGYRLKPQP